MSVQNSYQTVYNIQAADKFEQSKSLAFDLTLDWPESSLYARTHVELLLETYT